MRGERRKVFSERILHSLGWYVEHLRLTIEMHVRTYAILCRRSVGQSAYLGYGEQGAYYEK